MQRTALGSERRIIAGGIPLIKFPQQAYEVQTLFPFSSWGNIEWEEMQMGCGDQTWIGLLWPNPIPGLNPAALVLCLVQNEPWTWPSEDLQAGRADSYAPLIVRGWTKEKRRAWRAEQNLPGSFLSGVPNYNFMFFILKNH